MLQIETAATLAALAMPATLFIPDAFDGACRVCAMLRNALPAYSNRKIGGIRFLKLGRLNVSFSVSKAR